MKKLILATTSMLGLGIAGVGVGNAADTYNTSTTTPGATTQAPSSPTSPLSQDPQAATAPVNVSESQIRQAQAQLKNAGLYKETADGKMGAETKQAISQFQQQRGLTQTGTLDQETLAALNNQGTAGSSMSGSATQPPSSSQPLSPSTAPTTNR